MLNVGRERKDAHEVGEALDIRCHRVKTFPSRSLWDKLPPRILEVIKDHDAAYGI